MLPNKCGFRKMLLCILIYFSMLPTSPLCPNHKTLLGHLQLFTLGASILQVSSLTKDNSLVNQTKSTKRGAISCSFGSFGYLYKHRQSSYLCIVKILPILIFRRMYFQETAEKSIMHTNQTNTQCWPTTVCL